MYKVAISGKANSGKNTLTRLFTESLGGPYATKQKAFADPIKEGILKMYHSAVREELFGPSHFRAKIVPGTYITYRKLLCDVGALARAYDEDHWVKQLMEDFRISCLSSLAPMAYIVTDLRFPNEHAALKAAGFVLIRLKRKEALVIDDVSETSQDGIPDSAFHFVIENDSTLDNLHARALEIVQVLKDT